ncbi:MAG TPA: outer membrane beta-barrel protein [Bauldia sp.]|nr:outer membrane beta-barrel protein [Bauldia sp.]
MRKSIGASLAATAAAIWIGAAAGASAQAAEWNRAYLGAFAGAAFGQSDATTEIGCPGGGYICNPTQYVENGVLVGATGSGSATATAFAGGGFIGRSWQNGTVVYGLEADVGAMPFSITNGGSAASINPGIHNGSDPAIFSMHVTASADWLATARVRVGFLPTPNLLVYGTAGIAATELTVSNAYADNYVFVGHTYGHENATTSEFRTALALGAGVEWAVSDRWTMRAEYMHVDFGALTVAGSISFADLWLDVNPATSTASLRTDIVRAGVAYGF